MEIRTDKQPDRQTDMQRRRAMVSGKRCSDDLRRQKKNCELLFGYR